jgi:hypothetical protein
MSHSRRDFTRYAGYAAAGAVVLAPIALAAATWTPLDPAPRPSRAEGENVAAPAVEERRRPRDKDEKRRPKRDERKAKDSS